MKPIPTLIPLEGEEVSFFASDKGETESGDGLW
jgi:hypothetical protein